MSLPYPEHLARSYPPGVEPDRRRIEKCSDPKAWYRNMIGQIITVHYFCTFGAWDTQGRWLGYYDLSAPVGEEVVPTDVRPKQNKSWLKNSSNDHRNEI